MAISLDLLAATAVPGDFRPRPGPLGPWILTAPDEVAGWHRRVLGSGARAIRTATLGANRPGLAAVGLEDRVNEVNWTAARIAVEAAEDADAAVFGWVGPAGSRPEERAAMYREQLGALLDGGCRLLLFEGFSDINDMETAVEALRDLHHCPAVVLGPGEADDDTLEMWRRRAEGVGADVFGAWWPGPGGLQPDFPVVALAEGLPEPGGAGLFFAGSGVGPDEHRNWVAQFPRVGQ